MEDEENAVLKPILDKIAAEEKKLADVQAKIDAASGAKGTEKARIRDQLKQISANKNKAFGDNKALIQQARDLRNRQHALRDSINAVKEHMSYKRTHADDFVSRNLADINEKIAKGEAEQQTGKLSLREEKQKVAEIDGLRRLKNEITGIAAAVAELKNVDVQLAAVDAQLKDFSTGIDALKAQEDALKKELDSHKEGGVKYVDIGQFIEQRKALQANIVALIDQHNEEFARLDEKRKKYWAEQREKEQKEWAERKKAMDAFYAEKRAKREAYEKEKAKELPFEREVETCNHLLKYLEPLLAASKDEPAAADAKPAAAADAKPPAASAAKGATQKKGAAKKKKLNSNDPLTHAWKYYQAFEALSLQPPVRVAELDASIATIRAKRDEYISQQKAHEAAVKAKEEAEAKAKAEAAAAPPAPVPAPAAAEAPAAAPAPAPVVAATPSDAEGESADYPDLTTIPDNMLDP